MSELRKAAEMALEALESSRVFVTSKEKIKHPEGTNWYDESIQALRQALAQPEQEPVAWRLLNTSYRRPHYEYFLTRNDAENRQAAFNQSVDDGGLYELTPLYAAPPKREWVGLTDAEAKKTFEEHNCVISADLAGILARAIQYKLEEKNND